MRLKDIKISYKLGLGFGIMLFIAGIIGIVGNNNIDKMWHITENLYLHPLTVSKAVRDIRTNIIAMHRSMKDVALANNKEQIYKAQQTVDVYEQQVYKSFKVVFDRFLGDKKDVQSAYDAFIKWKSIRDEVIQLSIAGKKEEAADITKGKGAEHVALMNNKIQKMIDFANKKGDSFYKESDNVKNETTNNSLLLLLTSVLLGLTVTIFISHSILKPLSSIAKVSERLKEGDLSARNTDIVKDETGTLAQSINEMADSIEDQVFIRDGLKIISDIFIKSNNLNELNNNLLQQLTELTQSQLGAIYLLDNEHQKFQPYAFLGFQKEKLQGFDANAFEGEFGKTLITKEVTRISDIPENTRYVFKTVSGSALPKEIINIPVIVQDDVSLIISLASLQNYSELILEFIQGIWQSINTGFTSMLAQEDVLRKAKELKEQNQELETLTTELSSQKDELQEQNIELDEQRKQVESANKLKSEFLSNMSHELRTPLNSILSLSNVLKKKTIDRLTKEEMGYLDIVERNGKQLLELINDILDLSKIESGQMEINPSLLSLSDLIADLTERIKPIADEKGIELKVNFSKKLPSIITDEFLVQRIFQNIISNAVKFTKKGSVIITGLIKNDIIFIVVKDTGIGITKENLKNIFDEFHQVDGSTTRKYEGSGLGLAIAKKSALIMGGDVLVESKENKGSTFTVVLPVSFPEIYKNGIEFKQIVSEIEPDISSPKIDKVIELLIVEDQEPTIIQLTDLLEQSRFKVSVAKGGKEAIDFCRTNKPDGIILDLMMPEIDGFTVLETIRSKPELKKIPVLILTAKDLTKKELKRLNSNNIQQLVQKGDIDKNRFLNKIYVMLGLK